MCIRDSLGTVLKPIVFTNLDDDNVRGDTGTPPYDNRAAALGITGTWGGVILLGRGYVANNTTAGPNPAREIQVEGLNAAGSLGFYGNCSAASPAIPLGSCDDDDSGTLSYVSIRYGGFNLSANNEINGLTLGAVGRSTDIDHIEVFQNKDDGIELFGGAVNMKNIAMINGGDDGLDYDEGWRGKVQFMLVLQGTPGTDKSDKGSERDGGNVGDTSQPRSIPTIYNGTYIGLGGTKNYTDHLMNTALHFRDNAGGREYNSFFADFGGATMLIESGNFPVTGTAVNTSAGRTVAAYTTPSGNCSVTVATPCVNDAGCPGGETCVIHYQGPASPFELELEDNDFWCFGNGSVIPDVGHCSVTVATPCTQDSNCPGGETCVNPPTLYGAAATDAGKSHYAYPAFSNAALENNYFSCASPLPIRGLNRGTGAATAPDPILSLDPRPAPGGPLVQPSGAPNRTPPNDGFFTPAPYNGAFESGSFWMNGWSTMSRTGLLAVCSSASPLSVPGQVTNLSFAANGTTLSWTEPPLPGGNGIQAQDVLRKVANVTPVSAATADFSAATCLETNQFDDSLATDSSTPLVGQIFFYAARVGNACGEGTLGYYSNSTDRPAASCP